MNNLLTTTEVAKILDLTESRVRQLADELGARLIGRNLFFSASKVKAAKERGRPKPGPNKRKVKS